jgi:ATP-dependent DNA ligase
MAPRLEDIEPMLLGEVPRPFDTAGWTAELKFDGYRLLAGVEDSRVRLKSRNGANATSWYPELQSLASLPNGTILDGEVCVLDDIGRSDFMRLQARSRRRGRPAGSDPVVFCAFDLLVHRGQDMRAKPLKQRQAKLRRALEKPLARAARAGHAGQGPLALRAGACAAAGGDCRQAARRDPCAAVQEVAEPPRIFSTSAGRPSGSGGSSGVTSQ